VAFWLGAASPDQPLLLVLDDLQWAAKPTMLLIRHVVRSADPGRLLLIGTYRDTELSRNHPVIEVLADLRRHGSAERLLISGLDPSGVAAFMAEAAGHELDEKELLVARAIHSETEGNAFFVREVLRHLAETGSIEQLQASGANLPAIEKLGIPESVREVVGRRMSRLSEGANQTLRLAAVAGTEFELAVVKRAGGLEEGCLIDSLEEATGAHLLIEVPGAGRYRFAHALVRENLYVELSEIRRATLHQRVAEAIEAVHAGRLDDHLPALAHHWARASIGGAERDRAIGYANRAGDRALAQLAHDEAAGYYRQALELMADGPVDQSRRLELLIALGKAQRSAGNPSHRDILLEAGRLARQLGDFEHCALAALVNQRGLFSRFFEVDPERVVALEDALDALGPSDSPTRARLLASLSSELYFARDERRHALATQALSMARRLDDPATVADVLAAVWYSGWDPSGLAERAGLVRELLELAELLSDHLLQFHAGIALFLTAMQQGDVRRADAGLEACSRLADELGQPVLRWRVLYTRANRAMAVGRFHEAERLAEEAFQLGAAAGQPDSATYYHAGLSCIRFLEGRFSEAAQICELFPRSTPFGAGLAWAYALLDRRDEALVIVHDLKAQNFAAVPRDHIWLITLPLVGRACVCLGLADLAAEVYELLVPFQDEVIAYHTGWLGPVAGDLGILATAVGRSDEADTHFTIAVEILERIGSPALLANTRLEWGRMLFARGKPGDAGRARALLGDALATARELGLGRVEYQAGALLT
jgi:tetratricopeptide (TPR) repeat protein